jgi:hypothetical protein
MRPLRDKSDRILISKSSTISTSTSLAPASARTASTCSIIIPAPQAPGAFFLQPGGLNPSLSGEYIVLVNGITQFGDPHTTWYIRPCWLRPPQFELRDWVLLVPKRPAVGAWRLVLPVPTSGCRPPTLHSTVPYRSTPSTPTQCGNLILYTRLFGFSTAHALSQVPLPLRTRPARLTPALISPPCRC